MYVTVSSRMTDANAVVDLETRGEEVQEFAWTPSLQNLTWDLSQSTVGYFLTWTVNDAAFAQSMERSGYINFSIPRVERSSAVSQTTPTGLIAVEPLTEAQRFVFSTVATTYYSPVAVSNNTSQESGLSIGGIVGVVLVSTLVAASLFIGGAVFLLRRWAGVRVAKLAPGQQIVGPNEAFLMSKGTPLEKEGMRRYTA